MNRLKKFNHDSPRVMISLLNKQCADVDECEAGNACGTGALCTNTDGGFECSCPAGYAGDARVSCVDVDECAPPAPGAKNFAPACGRSAICDNLPGSFRCECPAGFKGDPLVACEGSFPLVRHYLSRFFFEFFFIARIFFSYFLFSFIRIVNRGRFVAWFLFFHFSGKFLNLTDVIA